MDILLYVVGAYLIGNIMFAYIVTRLAGGGDIRTVGSGNVGARNTGRIVGKAGFLVTFLGDAGKAILVLGIGEILGLSLLVQFTGFLAVILGHLFPVALSFKGGKGIASFIGGVIYLEPLILLPISGIFLLAYPFFRSFTKAGLVSLAFSPVYFLALSYETLELTIIVIILLFMTYAHRNNLREWKTGA